MFDIPLTRSNENKEGDKQFILELLDGLDKGQMKKFKEEAQRIMDGQEIHQSVMRSVYQGAYKFITARRMYKYEIEAYTERKIKGDYIDYETGKWVWLPRRDQDEN